MIRNQSIMRCEPLEKTPPALLFGLRDLPSPSSLVCSEKILRSLSPRKSNCPKGSKAICRTLLPRRQAFRSPQERVSKHQETGEVERGSPGLPGQHKLCRCPTRPLARCLGKKLSSGKYNHRILVRSWLHLGEKNHWHKSTLWEEATRIPFMISVPGLTKGGRDAVDQSIPFAYTRP